MIIGAFSESKCDRCHVTGRRQLYNDTALDTPPEKWQYFTVNEHTHLLCELCITNLERFFDVS